MEDRENLRGEVGELLSAMGVRRAEDDLLVYLAVEHTISRVKNLTNQTEFPCGLKHAAVRMAAGEFLRTKKAAGKLEGFQLEAAIKQVQEGDTNVVFATGEGTVTPEARLDQLIDYLLNSDREELYRYRRLVW